MAHVVISTLYGLAFVGGSIVIVLGSYFIARWRLRDTVAGEYTHEAASAIAGRIIALHGLILALVYAQELSAWKDLRSTIMEEEVAVSDVYNDIHRYGGPHEQEIQAGLANYVALVVGQEWDMLGRGEGLSADAWKQWDRVYGALLDLTPSSDREHYLAARLRDRITAVARFRQIREATALGGYESLFWVPALIGLALVAAPFYVYRPRRSHLILLSIFGAYSGVILFFIFAFSSPFQEPDRLEPVAMERLLQGDMGKSLPPGAAPPIPSP